MDYNTIAAIGLLAAGGIGFLWSNRGLLPKFTTATADDNTLDFQAWERLTKRQSLQCPECKEAFKTLGQHFMGVA